MKLEFKVNKPIDLVYNYISDVEKFAAVHPVITKISRISENSYLVFETLNFGFIPLSFKYPVVVKENNSEQKIYLVATVMRLVKIEILFELFSENNFTGINEVIKIKSFLPVKPFINYIFKKQHTQLFLNIENLK